MLVRTMKYVYVLMSWSNHLCITICCSSAMCLVTCMCLAIYPGVCVGCVCVGVCLRMFAYLYVSHKLSTTVCCVYGYLCLTIYL